MKNKYIFSPARIIIFLIVAAIVIGGGYFFSDKIESLINPETIKEGSLEDIKEGDLQLHYIYVGQGDCTAIKLPDGKTMLIDAGEETDAELIMTYLDGVFFDNGKQVIDYFVITHTDLDHIGGAVKLLETYDVKTVYRPMVTSKTEEDTAGVLEVTTKAWDKTVAAFAHADNVVTIEKDLAIEYVDAQDATNSYSFTFYGPIEDYYSDTNDYSPVMVLENNNKKYMFTGDASDSIEKDFLDAYSSMLAEFDVDVLKAGHHGSNTSSCEEFLDVVKPEYAIISCGIDNKYGHPHNEVISAFEDAQAQILRTDVSGSILLYNSGDDIKYIADFFEPAEYHIEWWYIASGIMAITAVVCFYPKSKVKRMARKAAKEAYKNK